MAKKKKSVRQYCQVKKYDFPSIHGKGDWICWLQVMSPAVEIQLSQPWLEERVGKAGEPEEKTKTEVLFLNSTSSI